VIDAIGAIERQLKRDRAAHAVADEVGALDVEGVEQCRGVGGHALVAQRSRDVAGASVALQFDGDHLEVLGECRQQPSEAALDRAHRAVKQDQRSAVAMALVVKIERAHVDVARRHRRRRPRLAGAPAWVSP